MIALFYMQRIAFEINFPIHLLSLILISLFSGWLFVQVSARDFHSQ